MIELNKRKVWGSGYTFNGKAYGDPDWREKIKSFVNDQKHVIVKGRNAEKSYDFNIAGFMFYLMDIDDFIAMLDRIEIGHFDDVYLYDAYDNQERIWWQKQAVDESGRYIFISHTATEYQQL